MALAEPHGPVAHRRLRSRFGRALACLACETVLVMALAAGAPAMLVGALHLATAAAGTWLIARGDGDFAPALVVGAATLALGPLGTAAAIAAIWRADRGESDPALASWHERIIDRPAVDPAEALYRDIVEGRAYRPGGVPSSFAATMASGDIGRRQQLLGLLAKRNAPVPEALLDAGLSAPELAVRAPAAAVVARLREREREAHR